MLARQVLSRGIQRTMKTTAVVRGGAAEWDDTEPMVHTAPHLAAPMVDENRNDYLAGSDARAAVYAGKSEIIILKCATCLPRKRKNFSYKVIGPIRLPLLISCF